MKLDFNDPAVGEWFKTVIKNQPQMIIPGLYKGVIKRMADELDIPLDLDRVRTEPGKPIIRPGKNLNKDEWGAWLLYYNTMQLAGFAITPEDIAALTGKSKYTVKSVFWRIVRDMPKFNT